MKTVTADAVTPSSFCAYFPEDPSPYVDRENIVDSIISLLSGDISILLIEGSGKSTALKSFLKANESSTFCIFLRPSFKRDYDPDSVAAAIYKQITWFVRGEEVRIVGVVSNIALQDAIMQLSRKLRKNSSVAYFIIDGLEHLKSEDVGTLNQIIGVLPVGVPGLKFIISGKLEYYANLLPKHHIKSWPLAGFNKDEIARFLAEYPEAESLSGEIYQITKGSPLQLAMLRRMARTKGLKATVNDMPSNAPDILALEWKCTEGVDRRVELLIALLAFDERKHTRKTLSALSAISEEDIEGILRPITFVETTASESLLVFASESHRRYAEKLLRPMRNIADEKIILSLTCDPDTEQSLGGLPQALVRAGRNEDALKSLTAERMQRLSQLKGSHLPLFRLIEVGLSAAEQGHKHDISVGMSVQKSTLFQVDHISNSRSEIAARISLGEYQFALALADGAASKDECLQLLAIYVKEMRLAGRTIEDAITARIKQVCDEVDFRLLGDGAVDIARDLMYHSPALAAHILKKKNSDNINSADVDLAIISMALASDSRIAKDNRTESLDQVQSSLSDPHAQGVSRSTRAVLGIYSAEALILECGKLEKFSDKLFMCRKWCLSLPKEGYEKVAIYATDLMLKSADFAPNATVFLELSTPLHRVTDPESRKSLLRQFDMQVSSMEKVGPTEDYVGFLLALCAAEKVVDATATISRLFAVYSYVYSLSNLSVKGGCYSRILSFLREHDKDGEIERSEKFIQVITGDLKKIISELLSSTADHEFAVLPTVKEMARVDPDEALTIALRLNSPLRRDRVAIEIVKSYISKPPHEIDVALLHRLIFAINDDEVRGQAIYESIKSFARYPFVDQTISNILSRLSEHTHHISDSSDRCNAICLTIAASKRKSLPPLSERTPKILSDLKGAWEAIGNDWRKTSIGYNIVKHLASVDRPVAEQYLAQADALKETLPMSGDGALRACFACIYLAMRSMAGLMKKSNDSDEDFRRMESLIDEIPSPQHKFEMYCDLASYYFLSKRDERAREIVNTKAKPLLTLFSKDDRVNYWQSIIKCAPALYYTHRTTSFDLFDSLPSEERDLCYLRVSTFIFCKAHPKDPFKARQKHAYSIGYDEISDIIEIAERMTSDCRIFGIIRDIANSSTSKRRDGLNRNQRPEVHKKVIDLIKKKLPANGYITHTGFVIVAEALALKIIGGALAEYEKLITRCKTEIKNAADLCYCLIVIAGEMPGTFPVKARMDALADARPLLRTMSLKSDRVERMEMYCKIVMDHDEKSFKEFLELAIRETKGESDPGLENNQDDLIDLAYQHDPEFAATLASMMDDDPARIHKKSNAPNELGILKVASELGKGASDKFKNIEEREYFSQYPTACWQQIGLMNSGRKTTSPLSDIIEHAHKASRGPVSRSYPIYCWIIENATKKYSETDQAKTILRGMFESLYSAAVMSAYHARSSYSKAVRTQRDYKNASGSNVVLSGAGREEAMDLIVEWTRQKRPRRLRLCDPYFGPSDLVLLKKLKDVDSSCEIAVLTSPEKIHEAAGGDPMRYEDAFIRAWRDTVSQDVPENIRIVIASLGSGKKGPIHDRWLLGEREGLRLGSSVGSIGERRVSEISAISDADCAAISDELEQYLTCSKRDLSGERIRYIIAHL